MVKLVTSKEFERREGDDAAKKKKDNGAAAAAAAAIIHSHYELTIPGTPEI
jgi:hypothetical protein